MEDHLPNIPESPSLDPNTAIKKQLKVNYVSDSSSQFLFQDATTYVSFQLVVGGVSI